ncbi:MAG TPA: HlyC/CorC family transporter [Caldithrix abyssi]|uniref:HlyC/CorC family transporter n=1 Tax=Caldithrix abyssi TaxID=187145 RepID=A0A7V5PQT6_CALAY|nr:HlyC/CorC family transporter [Caldithrix abyssi]
MNLLFAILGILATFFFAGSEAAYTAFNKIRADIWRRQKRRFITPLIHFIEEPEKFFTTILIGNNLANILFTTFATVLLMPYMNETEAWATITFIVLFLGEIYPKTLFRLLADRIIIPVTALSQFFYWLFHPAIVVLSWLIEKFLRLFRVQHAGLVDYFSREEMEILLRGAGNLPGVEKERNKYIANVLEFWEVKVREAMTPRTEMVAAEDDATPEDVLDLMVQSDKQHVVIYHDDLDDVRGVVFIYDLIDMPDKLAPIIHPLEYVPENKSCAALLKEFQQKNISVALVVDEYGGTAGLITMDDLIEEVFGDLFEEQAEPQMRALNKNTWLVDGRYQLDELEEKLKLEFPEGDYDTVAGLVLSQLGHIPKPGEVLRFDGLRIEVVKASAKKIEQLKIVKEIKQRD